MRFYSSPSGRADGSRKYQFMEMNLQKRVAGLKDKIPDIQKTLDTVRFLKLRRVSLLPAPDSIREARRNRECAGADVGTGRPGADRDGV